MKRKILEYLVCPVCLPEEVSLHLARARTSGDEIEEGFLECRRCGKAYGIEAGTALMADGGRDGKNSPYETPDLLSAYLWSHYADFCGDPDASGAYAEWADLISGKSGTGLDIGCAVGRFSIEMSRKCELVIGVDLSSSFVRTARRIAADGGLTFGIKEEGLIRSERAFTLPPELDTSKLEFIVADAGALPFRSGTFDCVASLNLLDKVTGPLEHLSEASRAARRSGAQLLMSDPFSWSPAVCPPEKWIGGVTGGRFAGAGIDNLSRLLANGDGEPAGPAWNVVRKGEVWWKIRNHRNHFELIRSQFIKAER